MVIAAPVARRRPLVTAGTFLALVVGALLASLVPAGHRPVIHLSLTDDHPYAQAFVIIEAVPHVEEFMGARGDPGLSRT